MSAVFYLPHDGRSFRVKQFHADFDEWFLFAEFIEKFQSFFCARKIERDDYVLSHCAPLL